MYGPAIAAEAADDADTPYTPAEIRRAYEVLRDCVRDSSSDRELLWAKLTSRHPDRVMRRHPFTKAR